MSSTPAASPSIISVVIGTTIVAGVAGYFLGQALTVGIVGGGGRDNGGGSHRDDKQADEETGSEDEGGVQDGLRSFEHDGGECKLTLVVRMDLGMGKGKIAAQCSHATLACYKSLQFSSAGQSILRRWGRYGQAKVALKVESEEELELLQAKAISLGVCAQIIHDAGRTQIASGSATVLGVGPAPKSVVDQVTGGLKLL